MKNFVSNITASVKSIHWPSAKSILMNTILTMGATVVLSILILLWTTGIEEIVKIIVNWF